MRISIHIAALIAKEVRNDIVSNLWFYSEIIGMYKGIRVSGNIKIKICMME